MPSIVQTNRHLGLSKGQHRVVFRNPRGLKRYYAVYVYDGVPDVFDTTVREEYSTDGINWGNAQTEVFNFDETGAAAGIIYSFDVKMHDDGSQLEVWAVAVGWDAVEDAIQTRYAYGTIADAESEIVWNIEQVIDAAINDEGLGEPHCIALARTDNGEIVVAFTEDLTNMGKDYRLTKLIGSDGDGASPSWGGETIWNDPTGNSNNQDKAEVWFGLENYSSSYPNRCFLYARVPNAATAANYIVLGARPDWNGIAFSNTSPTSGSDFPHADAGKLISAIVDEEDYAHLLYFDGNNGELASKKSIGRGSGSLGLDRVITTSDVDAATLTYEENPPADVPTSDELVGGWTSTEGDLHSAIDEGYVPNDAEYIDNTLDNTCRLGGFEGGLDAVVVRAAYTGAGGATIAVATYLGGVLVETLEAAQVLSGGAVDHEYAPTNNNWDEIVITSTKNASTSARIYNLHVERRHLYVFYHIVADSVDFNYKFADSERISWSDEKIVSYHQDIIALTSWNRVIENSLHIGGLFGTTVIYNEHPVYKALSTTLADLEFPDQNYYLGPHST
jgi:hypothetical protein